MLSKSHYIVHSTQYTIVHYFNRIVNNHEIVDNENPTFSVQKRITIKNDVLKNICI